MIKQIDRLVNRAYFSIYEAFAPLCYLLSLLLYWLFWRSICSIPFIKKRMKKYFKDDDYKSLVKNFDDWSPYKNSKSFYRLYGHDYVVSMLFFFLPISFVINAVVILVGNPLKLLYSK